MYPLNQVFLVLMALINTFSTIFLGNSSGRLVFPLSGEDFYLLKILAEALQTGLTCVNFLVAIFYILPISSEFFSGFHRLCIDTKHSARFVVENAQCVALRIDAEDARN